MAEDVAKTSKTSLHRDIEEKQWPIVYSPEYNISFMGMEKLHPFDAGKWGHIYNFLKEAGMLYDETTVRAQEASKEDLLFVHTDSYINSLKWSANVAGITEVPPMALLPNFIVQRKVLKPFRFQTGGTILAAWLALQRGWSINLGGGFHHCCAKRGGGFCAYADITLAIRYAMSASSSNPPSSHTHDTSETLADSKTTLPSSKEPAEEHVVPPPPSSPGTVLTAAAVEAPGARVRTVRRTMIVDLDAHQGNGHERDFMDAGDTVYILDVYNRDIYPHDGFAKRAINRKVELQSFTEDEEYLRLVRTHLEGALNEFSPDLIVYNAGTDILQDDPLGCLSITPQGIIERDEIVFEKARGRDIPIVMVTSGGYQKSTARIIADSILNLRQKGLIACEQAEQYQLPTVAAPALTTTTLSRCQSEGGLWAKFKSCTNLTRSSTPEYVAQTPAAHSPLPAMVRSRTADSRLSAAGQSRSPGATPGSRLQESGSSLGIARSRTQDDVRGLEEAEDFFDEQLDFRAMMQGRKIGSAATSVGKTGEGDGTKKKKIEEEETVDEYDSSPYDSDDSDCIVNPHNTVFPVLSPSYEEFVRSKELLTVGVDRTDAGEDVDVADEEVDVVDEEVKVVDEEVKDADGEVNVVDEETKVVDGEVKVVDEVNVVDGEVKVADGEVKVVDGEVKVADGEVKVVDEEVKVVDEDLNVEEVNVRVEDVKVVADKKVKVVELPAGCPNPTT